MVTYKIYIQGNDIFNFNCANIFNAWKDIHIDLYYV